MLFHRKLTKRMGRLRKANDLKMKKCLYLVSHAAPKRSAFRAPVADASPRHRVAAISCGHVFCYACVVKTGGVCPIGLEPTTFLHIIEDDEATRQCAICYCENPMERSVFVGCGHVFCSACIWAHLVGSLYAWHSFNCPFCRLCSRFTTLIEEPIRLKEDNMAKEIEPATAHSASKSRSFVERLARFFTLKTARKN